MNIEDFRKLDLDGFYRYGIEVSKFNRFPDYYNEYLSGRGICLYYTQYQEFLWAIKDSRFRYIEVEIGNDSVCVFFKCIFYAKRLKFYDLPVSKLGIMENVEEVTRIILNKDFVSSIVLDEDRIKNCIPEISVDSLERNYMSDNFYSDLEFVENRMSSSFRSKYGINKLKNHLTYRFVNGRLSDEDRDTAIDIYKEWASKAASPGEFREFKNMLRYVSDNVSFLFTYYDEDPISISIILNCNKFFIEEFCYTKARSDFDDREKKKSLNKIVFYAKYLELKYMKENYGVDTIYVLGSGHVSKTHGLYLNKNENNRGFVKYYELKRGVLDNVDWRKTDS